MSKTASGTPEYLIKLTTNKARCVIRTLWDSFVGRPKADKRLSRIVKSEQTTVKTPGSPKAANAGGPHSSQGQREEEDILKHMTRANCDPNNSPYVLHERVTPKSTKIPMKGLDISRTSNNEKFRHLIGEDRCTHIPQTSHLDETHGAGGLAPPFDPRSTVATNAPENGTTFTTHSQVMQTIPTSPPFSRLLF